MEEAHVSFIIRDHVTAKLEEYETRLKSILLDTLSGYPQLKFSFVVKEQYRNMKEIIKDVPFVTDNAIEAMKRVLAQDPTNTRALSEVERMDLVYLSWDCLARIYSLEKWRSIHVTNM